MNERVILALLSLLRDYEKPIGLDWPEQKKEEVIFSHWALDEIFNLVWDHPWTLASETIENFARKLEVYAATAVSKDQKRIFTVAAETAWQTLDEIYPLEI